MFSFTFRLGEGGSWGRSEKKKNPTLRLKKVIPKKVVRAACVREIARYTKAGHAPRHRSVPCVRSLSLAHSLTLSLLYTHHRCAASRRGLCAYFGQAQINSKFDFARRRPPFSPINSPRLFSRELISERARDKFYARNQL